VSATEVCGRCRERVLPVRRKGEMPTAERVYEIGALGGGGRVLRSYVVGAEEWAAREEADRLRYCGLKEATECGVCGAVGGENLAECEKCRDASAIWC
jgi:hypothetical protein